MSAPDLRPTILGAWRTTNRLTTFLIEAIPPDLWASAIPGAPRRTIRMMAGHIHNSRCQWIKTLGEELGIPAPVSVDRRKVVRRTLVAALNRSSKSMLQLLTLGCEHGGWLPPTSAYVWRNLPLDIGHVLCYFVAHEAYHRGQIVLAARALNLRLPSQVTDGLWQWNKRSLE
jgi:uncharacterized damage-inducible protein DinB